MLYKFSGYGMQTRQTPKNMPTKVHFTGFNELAALNKPASTDRSSVENWLDDQEQAPIISEESWIQNKEDLITLKPGRDNAWLDQFVERLL